MIDTKFQTLAKNTSLQSLWLEVVKEDKFRNIEIAKLQGKIKTLEDGLFKRREVAVNHNKRLKDLEGETNLTTPDKKSIWDFFLKRK